MIDHNTESPLTQPLITFHSPPDSSSIRVRVHNAVMRKKTPNTTPPLPDSSPPSHTSTSTTTLVNDHSLSKHLTKVSSKIYILGPYAPQYMEFSDTSTSSRSSRASKSATHSLKPSLFRSKSTTGLSALVESQRVSEGFSASPALSIQSFDGVIRRTAAEKIASFRSESRDSDIHERGSTGRQDASHDVFGPEVHTGLKGSENKPHSYDAGTVARLLNECMESRAPPLPQKAMYRAVKRSLHSRYVCSSRFPTEGIRAVMERKLRSQAPSVDTVSSTSTESDGSIPGRRCCSCGRKKSIKQWMRLIPCQHTTCSSCFSATLSATTVSRSHSNCPSCHTQIYTFTAASNDPTPAPPRPSFYPVEIRQSETTDNVQDYPVLRIDNVAWDITPQVVEEYLPKGVLPAEHPQPIHVLLDRLDGRTKDYMYVEVIDEAAARRVLKHRQHSFMPGGPLTGGRKRPVTITSVSPFELLSELRPRSATELNGLLSLCQTAVSAHQLANPSVGNLPPMIAPSGVAHYVKSRHGPFYAVMSILSKLRGRSSPAYWDVFYMASGAMKALAQASPNLSNNLEYGMTPEEINIKAQDDHVLERLSRLFHSTLRDFKQ